MEIYLIFGITIPIFALRYVYVRHIHFKHDSEKSDYQFFTGDLSIESRSTRLKWVDYIRILAWRERDFIDSEYKQKIEQWKN